MRKLLALAPMLGVVGVLLCLGRPLQAGEKEQAVKTIKDVAYRDGKDADAEKHRLDLYLPAGKKHFPVLVFVHGGGWTRGNRSSFARVGPVLARQGIGVAAISYRLSPAVKHPEHIRDVAAAFAWVHKNIKKYGGDPQNLFISGHSAGGHLAALLATNDDYLEACGLSRKDIRGAIPISGVYEIKPGGKTDIFPEGAEQRKEASPLSHVDEECPPFLILYAEKDGTGFDRMAQRLCAALKQAKVAATCREIADRNHGSIVSSIDSPDDPTAQAIIAFIRQHSTRE